MALTSDERLISLGTEVVLHADPAEAPAILHAAAGRLGAARPLCVPPQPRYAGVELAFAGGVEGLLTISRELRADLHQHHVFRLALQLSAPAAVDRDELHALAMAVHHQHFSAAETHQIRAELPLMNAVLAPYLDSRPLAGTAPMVTGHFLNDLVHLVDCLIMAGARPEAITVLRKDYAYRLRHRVEAHLLERGVTVAPIAEAERAIAEHSAKARAARLRALALDDGGYVLPALLDRLPDLLPAWCGVVEQTMSGIYKLERYAGRIPLPVFSVAQSRLKGTIESYWIADKAVEAALGLLPPMIIEGRPALVIGYGQIGAQIAHRLKARHMKVAAYDIDVLRLIAAHEEGFATANTLPALLAEHKPVLIFGATGRGAMSRAAFGALTNDCYLASCTSRDTEFDLPALRELSVKTRRTSDAILSHWLPHGVDVHLLADGRPVNFYEGDSITNQRADLVFAGMLVGAVTLAGADPRFGPGVQRTAADEVLEDCQVLDRYYELYGPEPLNADDSTAARQAVAASVRAAWA
jgi:adenosylhomocysteinase